MSNASREMDPIDPELRRLVDGVFAQRLTQEEVVRLQEWLAADAEAMAYYLEISAVEALLPAALKSVVIRPQVQVAPKPGPTWRPWLAMAAVLLVFVGVAGLVLRAYHPRPSASSVLATITGMEGVKWGELGGTSKLGQSLGREDVSITDGLLEITHASGAKVLLQGPASYHVMDANSGRMDYGKLVANVPHTASGFTVYFQKGRVVDVGTEFAVAVPMLTGAAEVGVLRGAVDVGNASGQTIGRLTVNNAVQFDPGAGNNVQPIPFLKEKFVRSLPSMPVESEAEKSARTAWWREARFGLLIHWGLYSVPAGVYNGRSIGGSGSDIMGTAQIPVKDYSALAARCQRLGWDIARDTIAKIEAGTRWVGDFELVHLARSLEVPLEALFPSGVRRTLRGSTPH